jgi:histidinol dehydrogenase
MVVDAITSRLSVCLQTFSISQGSSDLTERVCAFIRHLHTKDITEAIKISNQIAPEHLELCVEDPESMLDGIFPY